jgi:hypothetical protein
MMTCTLAPSEENAVRQPGPPPLLCARRRLRPVHLEVAFSITARSLTFHVDSQVPLTSFLSSQTISSAALLPKESVEGRTRFTRRGRHLPLFRGRARYRAKTPAVVHRSFEQSSKCSLVIPLAGKMVRDSHTRFASNRTPRTRRTFSRRSSLLAHPDHTTLSNRPEDEQRARRGDVCSPHSSVFNDAHPRLVRLPIRSGTEIPLLIGRAFRSRRNAQLRRATFDCRALSTRISRR